MDLESESVACAVAVVGHVVTFEDLSGCGVGFDEFYAGCYGFDGGLLGGVNGGVDAAKQGANLADGKASCHVAAVAFVLCSEVYEDGIVGAKFLCAGLMVGA